MKLCLESDLCAIWTLTPDNLNIVDPNNQLEPISSDFSTMFLIDIALKIENVLNKIIDVIVNGIIGIFDSII